MTLEDLLKDNPDVLKVVQDAIAATNEGQTDESKHVRFVDLSEGGYVAKADHDILDAENQTNSQKLSEANALIEQLKAGTEGNEDLQTQITTYKGKVETLENELAQVKLDAAVKVGLLSEHAEDIDYLTFKLKSAGESLELDEQGKIKGWNDKVTALKTQFPTQFKNGAGGSYDGFRPLEEHQQHQQQGLTKAELLKKPYAEQLKYYNENPDGYNEIMKG